MFVLVGCAVKEDLDQDAANLEQEGKSVPVYRRPIYLYHKISQSPQNQTVLPGDYKPLV
jgi:hypothetical protein